jgi:hypothetical protein
MLQSQRVLPFAPALVCSVAHRYFTSLCVLQVIAGRCVLKSYAMCVRSAVAYRTHTVQRAFNQALREALLSEVWSTVATAFLQASMPADTSDLS